MKKLVINNKDITSMFMRDDIHEILVTTDTTALLVTEDNVRVDCDTHNIDWSEVVEFGMKKIVTTSSYDYSLVDYNKVTAVMIVYAEGDVENFINQNCILIQKVY